MFLRDCYRTVNKFNETRLNNKVKMKVQDLRIGNLVKEKGCVVPIGFRSFQYMSENEKLFFAWVRPIPLTEEWLLKFGFVFDGFRYQQEINNNLWVFVKNNVYGWYSPHIEISNGIKYVHSLQNLLHALTGEELEIKEAK